MHTNKSNKEISIQQLDKTLNRKEVAEELLATAESGFLKGSPWRRDHFYHTLEATNSIIFTASMDEDEKIVGLLIGSIAVSEVDIYMVVVDETYKKNRIAYQLFEHLIAHCREEGIESIFLEVRMSNEPAIGLYERLDFERVGVRKAYYSSPIEDAIVMELKL